MTFTISTTTFWIAVLGFWIVGFCAVLGVQHARDQSDATAEKRPTLEALSGFAAALARPIGRQKTTNRSLKPNSKPNGAPGRNP